MKTRFAIPSCFVVAFLVVVAGCGPDSGSIAPISGKLTLDGQPMAGVEIVFSPISTQGNSNPGPWSVSLTDVEGNYEMKTRYGETGAVIGKHHVTMAYADLEPGAMEQLRADLKDARASGENPNEIRAEIEALTKKLKGRRVIPSNAERDYEVVKGGNTNENFELVSD